MQLAVKCMKNHRCQNYYDEKRFKGDGDFDLRPGIVLAIEPMVNVGTKSVKCLDDHWTIVTRDAKKQCAF